MRGKSKELAARRAFEAEALSYLDSLYAVAMKLTRNASDAEDLVQDAYVRAHRFQDRFEPGTHMKAWLLRILTNLFINRYRRSTREREVLAGRSAAAVGDGVMSRAAVRALKEPVGEAHRALLESEIQKALDELPDDHRLVVVLADIEELSYREISSVLNCPVGTVMSRLHRARQKLRSRLVAQAQAMGIVDAGTALGAPAASTQAPEAVSLAEYRRRRRQGVG